MESETLETYIETVDELQKKEKRARTKKIAKKLKVKEPSVTEMLHKLKKKGFVSYEPYQGATLTRRGEKIANELRERHFTLAEFLEMLGVDEKTADEDACKIEHIVNPKTMKKLRKFLKFVKEAPEKPQWLEHYKHFVETGEHQECERRED